MPINIGGGWIEDFRAATHVATWLVAGPTVMWGKWKSGEAYRPELVAESARRPVMAKAKWRVTSREYERGGVPRVPLDRPSGSSPWT